ncbi:hypothetical protein HC928_21395 [bacterium]|nr:hypothetical protein [bacterium]
MNQPGSPTPKRPILSSEERKQIRDLLRFLAIVLFFVMAAALVMAMVTNVLR